MFVFFFQGVMKRGLLWGKDNFCGYLFGARGDKDMGMPRFGRTSRLFRSSGNQVSTDTNFRQTQMLHYPRPVLRKELKPRNPPLFTRCILYLFKEFPVGLYSPNQMDEKYRLTKCRVFVSGENLLTGTSLSSLFDPETISGGNGGNALSVIKHLVFWLKFNTLIIHIQ